MMTALTLTLALPKCADPPFWIFPTKEVTLGSAGTADLSLPPQETPEPLAHLFVLGEQLWLKRLSVKTPVACDGTHLVPQQSTPFREGGLVKVGSFLLVVAQLADPKGPSAAGALHLLQDERPLFTLPTGGTLRIGRAPGNHLRLEEKTVSRHHAEISWGVLHPQKPLLLNGRVLKRPRELKPGDRLTLGELQLLVGEP